MSSTVPKIDFEYWKALDDQAQKLCESGDKLYAYVDLDPDDVPEADIQNYVSDFKDLWAIIEETSQKCSGVKPFIAHDFGNKLTPLYVGVKSCERGKMKLGWPIVCTNLYVNRLIKHVIGSIKFYVDGELAVKRVSLFEFFAKEKKLLEKVFSPGKVTFNFDGNYTVKMDEDTLGTLLMNMVKNAKKHGEAENLLISTYWVGGKDVTLFVADDGKGIDPTEEDAGERGFVTDVMKYGVSRGEGSGLGLANMEERMQAMGGRAACIGHGGLVGRHGNIGAKFIITLMMG